MAASQVDPTKTTTIPVTVVNPGSLDANFDTDGIVSTTLGNFSEAKFTLTQTDGKIIAIGNSDLNVGTNAQPHFTLVRYNTDGTIDTSFGPNGNGFVKTILGTQSFPFFGSIQADGKIVVSGYSNLAVGSNTEFHFTLVRYNTDGTVDTSFGPNGSGFVKTKIGTQSIPFFATVQTDGKIILVGRSNLDVGGNVQFHFTLVRYNTDGTVDTSFGPSGTGFVKTILGSGSSIHSVSIQGDGKIIAVGQSNLDVGGNVQFHFTLVRYNTDGTVDTSFGPSGTGFVKTILGSGSSANSISIQGDGKIIAVGQSNLSIGTNAQTHFTLVRYNTDGTVDTSFGPSGTGFVKTILGSSSFPGTGTFSGAGALSVIQNDGKIIVAGQSNLSVGSGNTESHFTLVRYNMDGTVDTSFGPNGTGFVKTVLGTSSFPYSVKIQSDGTILTSGFSNILNSASNHFTLTRHQTGAPSTLLRANLSGDQEASPVTTTAIGSATFVINPGGTEISFTVATSDLNVSTVTATHIHFAAPDGSDPILFSLPSSGFVSPLSGKITSANLGPLASVLPGVYVAHFTTLPKKCPVFTLISPSSPEQNL
ncbi:MAG: CHRD domain-containing protein [Candidatus Manganitrophus sp.]|nr:CHRD domain-containing protein [Candidatus Manganitrophus sp.]